MKTLEASARVNLTCVGLLDEGAPTPYWLQTLIRVQLEESGRLDALNARIQAVISSEELLMFESETNPQVIGYKNFPVGIRRN